MASLLVTGAVVVANPEDAAPPVRGAISIRDGRIHSVGDPTRQGHHDHVIDVGGATVIPGLVDSHVHLTMDEADESRPRRHNEHGDVSTSLAAAHRAHRAIESGITTVRDCMTTTHGIFALRRAIDIGQHIGPRTLLCGRALVAHGGHMHPIAREVSGTDDVVVAVREQIKDGADLIKVCIDASSLTPSGWAATLQLRLDEVGAAVEAAHQLGVKVAAHAVSAAGIDRALTAGVDSIEHGTELDAGLAERMAETGTFLVPTLSVHGAFVRHLSDSGHSGDAGRWSEVRLAQGMAATALAQRTGVPIAMGSDAGSPYNRLWEPVQELELMVQAGLSPREVLATATIGAARLLGLDDDIGLLTPGRRADLVAVAGDVIANISAVRDVRLVVADGAVVLDRTAPTMGA